MSTMWAPIRPESSVLSCALTGGLLVAVSALTGWLAEPLAGVIVFLTAALVVILTAVVAYLSTVSQDRPLIPRRAIEKPRPRNTRTGKRRATVIATRPHRHRPAPR